jgi:hypothetical protein
MTHIWTLLNKDVVELDNDLDDDLGTEQSLRLRIRRRA